MANENPFAAPDDDIAPVYDVVDGQGQVWRAGKLLVFHRNAPLPHRCIKCNTNQDVTMRQQKLYYYPLWILLFLFCNLLVLIIVAIVFRKSATTHLGICGNCRRRRRNGILLSCLLLFAGVALLISLAIVPDSLMPQSPETIAFPLLFSAVACLIAAAIVGVVRGQLLVVRKIDSDQVRLGKINREYLAMLPEGP